FGTINLDQATSAENLDLFVLFSSVAGAMGNLGQCDYAYANHFLDSFAESREILRKKQKRFGKTLSINWPFWQDGGMTISPNDIAFTERQTGMSPLPTAEGFQYWEEFLRSDLSQGIALYGMPTKIEAYVAQESLSSNKNQSVQTQVIDPELLLEKTEEYLKVLISEEIKLAPERIDSEERFESFGIDSIMIGRFNVSLERDLGALPKTLFYEYETIEELAKYLTQDAEQALIIFFNLEHSVNDFLPQINEAQTKFEAEKSQEEIHTEKNTDDQDPIAIIGVHGYYPHSNDLDEYWENLKLGKDLVD
ncbi:MAG: KR domain-containing protein, partial [Sphingobacteriales bacterium]